jgi:hypothetical protein
MSGKKARGRANRAKRGAAAAHPRTQQVENSHEATDTLTHTPDRVTGVQLSNRLNRFIESALVGIKHASNLWVASEYTDDVAALTAAAERGDMNAQVAMITRSVGTHKDNAWFMRSTHEDDAWFRRGEAQGNMSALLYFGLNMAYVYLNNIVDEGPRSEAIKDGAMAYLRVPADRGSSTAQHALGMLIYYSRHSSDTKFDLPDAVRWIRKAAMQGLMDAQYELGEMFRHGVFCDHIYMRLARKYIRRASVQGHVEAIARMKDLRSCVLCGADGAPLACSLCRQARYCNSRCSEKHWCEGGGVGGGVSGGAGARHKATCPRTHTSV